MSRSGQALGDELLAPVLEAEALGVDYLLVAQRWWGSGEEIEGSSYDCLAMTSFYAARTERIGLITRVVPDGTALKAAREVADTIAANGPLSIKAIKQSVRETEGMSELDGLARELDIGTPIFMTEDAQEGPKAFSEKRTPNFKGK